jgi:DNA-binding XRE family transcriptional regulator
MPKPRTYSKYALEAAALLGKQLKLARKQRRWTESDLAERAGISRATVQKIEKGDMSCKLGLAFEVAALVGVELFSVDLDSLSRDSERLDDKLALLPKKVRKPVRTVDDEF